MQAASVIQIAATKCEGVTIDQLNLRSCRFIPGDTAGESTIYCGETRRDDKTRYCAFHHALCYMPALPRKVNLRPRGASHNARILDLAA